MKKYFQFLTVLLLAFLCGCSQDSPASETEYEFLTPQVLVLKNPRPYKYTSHKVQKSGSWQKENALFRNQAGNILRKADITFYKYIIFEKPLKAGEKVSIAGAVVQYDPAIPSNIFKLNQVGNATKQKQKYAYMGAWLGNSGALPLKHLAGKEFEIRNAADDQCVFKNVLKLRCSDPLYQYKIPFTGEEVLELDYSSFNTPGKYYFYVDTIGRSMVFEIGSETLNEAFYIHARGLYHKRCGIAKTQPFTAWASPLCHPTVVLGRFPGNAEDYRKGNGKKSYGFFDIKDNPIEVRHFDLIRDNPPYKNITIPASGGWHDAADYDRRPYHLRIVSDLASVYLMKPENFIDGQLNIPESGNHVPDILDEAAWGVRHLIQNSNGGVGTWIETTSHPGPGEGLPDRDKRVYQISAPSRNGTLEYAAAVSTLALAMKASHRYSYFVNQYLKSAEKAWEFAEDLENRLVCSFIYRHSVIFYREEPDLNSENLLKAGLNLFLLTGKKKYLEPILNAKQKILDDFKQNFWRWSPLTWMALELYPTEELQEFRAEYRKVILRDAEKMLADQETAYPYRTLWHSHNAGWVHAMSWGIYHPLRRAMILIAAHKMTGLQKYLDGAYLANDFHNGANPLGRSMTSGLGKIYPAVFLDLISYADGISEFVPGITPYGNTFGLDRNAVLKVYQEKAEKLPIWRRYVNLEFLSVPSSEYSVWETIAPAAVVSGYLIEKPALPQEKMKKRKPAKDYRKLPGYRALP